jgi:hypothetical protein
LILVPVIATCGRVAGENPAAAIPIWHLEEEIRFGGVESSLDLRNALFLIPDARVLYFAETGGRAASISETGELLYAMGGKGDGPGEFRLPQGIQLIADTLWVLDNISGMRIEGFHDGRAAKSVRTVMQTDDGPLMPFGMNADGTILVEPRRARNIRDIAFGLTTASALLRATRAGELLDTVVVRPVFTDDYFPVTLPAGSGAAQMPVQHSPLTRAFPDGSAVVVVDRQVASSAGGAAYRVTVHGIDSIGSRTSEIPYEPITTEPFIPIWVDQWRQRLEADGGSQDVIRVYREAMLSRLTAFPFLPPITEVRVGDEFIWLRRESLPDADSVWWDIVETGMLTRVARVALPKNVMIAFPAEDWIWAMQNDSLDVPELIRFRIRR